MEQLGRLPVPVDCLLIAAQLVVDVAEAVGDVGLSVHITGLPGEFEGLLAVSERAEMVAEVRLPPADVVQRGGLSCPVTRGPVVLQAPIGVFQGEFGVALSPDIRERC